MLPDHGCVHTLFVGWCSVMRKDGSEIVCHRFVLLVEWLVWELQKVNFLWNVAQWWRERAIFIEGINEQDKILRWVNNLNPVHTMISVDIPALLTMICAYLLRKVFLDKIIQRFILLWFSQNETKTSWRVAGKMILRTPELLLDQEREQFVRDGWVVKFNYLLVGPIQSHYSIDEIKPRLLSTYDLKQISELRQPTIVFFTTKLFSHCSCKEQNVDHLMYVLQLVAVLHLKNFTNQRREWLILWNISPFHKMLVFNEVTNKGWKSSQALKDCLPDIVLTTINHWHDRIEPLEVLYLLISCLGCFPFYLVLDALCELRSFYFFFICDFQKELKIKLSFNCFLLCQVLTLVLVVTCDLR